MGGGDRLEERRYQYQEQMIPAGCLSKAETGQTLIRSMMVTKVGNRAKAIHSHQVIPSHCMGGRIERWRLYFLIVGGGVYTRYHKAKEQRSKGINTN